MFKKIFKKTENEIYKCPYLDQQEYSELLDKLERIGTDIPAEIYNDKKDPRLVGLKAAIQLINTIIPYLFLKDRQ